MSGGRLDAVVVVGTIVGTLVVAGRRARPARCRTGDDAVEPTSFREGGNGVAGSDDCAEEVGGEIAAIASAASAPFPEESAATGGAKTSGAVGSSAVADPSPGATAGAVDTSAVAVSGALATVTVGVVAAPAGFVEVRPALATALRPRKPNALRWDFRRVLATAVQRTRRTMTWSVRLPDRAERRTRTRLITPCRLPTLHGSPTRGEVRESARVSPTNINGATRRRPTSPAARRVLPFRVRRRSMAGEVVTPQVSAAFSNAFSANDLSRTVELAKITTFRDIWCRTHLGSPDLTSRPRCLRTRDRRWRTAGSVRPCSATGSHRGAVCTGQGSWPPRSLAGSPLACFRVQLRTDTPGSRARQPRRTPSPPAMRRSA